MKKQLRLALLQMNIDAGNPEINFGKLRDLLEEVVQSEKKPDVIMFPEMWNTGYALTEIEVLADSDGMRTKKFLSSFSKEHNVYIIGGSIAEKKTDGVYNTIYAFDRDGNTIADYSKIHLFRLMDEEKFLKAGAKHGKLEIEGEQAGMMICYDIRFPELTRTLALGGAKILFVPAEWPHPRLHHWRTLLMARAIENQMYVVACNRMGKSGETNFFGHSLVIDPWGEIVAEAGEEETILYADIDLDLVDQVRTRIPVFEDRRPELYSKE
ncbi:carbon-nitrogen family hydrolase [Paenibacillus sp. GSMTC-2017]|uniref:carbon-nitrogen family hydrolase n=1 Tax=Paenibacillus sp. GSMTC-2017 TaxID=2794350 RepID=UPI0018D7B1AF|nr:carbon-nitrogen family hydrolase [Paenibacillus sp. GSMTC-2017]MBH5317900.1 carbon-nitrogen family hydrolase [Paenibacillus sp. GSMTC-2017]